MTTKIKEIIEVFYNHVGTFTIQGNKFVTTAHKVLLTDAFFISYSSYGLVHPPWCYAVKTVIRGYATLNPGRAPKLLNSMWIPFEHKRDRGFVVHGSTQVVYAEQVWLSAMKGTLHMYLLNGKWK